MAWLDDHPPVRSQFRRPRREGLSGVIVVHTAENAPDYVAFDGGAEAVARFIQNRTDPGSYHDLCDSDSAIGLVSYDDEAFHDGTGTNPHSLGLSIATRADTWPFAPQAWRDGAIEQAAQQAARMAAHVKARRGIVVPARRITADQARARVPGFTTHAQLDPTRRSDPGSGFPWDQFLGRYAELTTQEEDMDLTQANLDSIEKVVTAALGKAGLSGTDHRFTEIKDALAGLPAAVVAALPPSIGGAGGPTSAQMQEAVRTVVIEQFGGIFDLPGDN